MVLQWFWESSCKCACFLCNTRKCCLDWKAFMPPGEIHVGESWENLKFHYNVSEGKKKWFFSLLTLFYSGKTQRAFKNQASTQWKENGHSESLFCNCLVFLLCYCVASKFKCYLGDLAKHLPQLFTLRSCSFPHQPAQRRHAALKRCKEQFSHSDN